MKLTYCYKCADHVHPLVIGESIVQCPHCHSDLSDRNDPVFSREVRREALRNGSLPEAEIALKESSIGKGDESLVEDILIVAFEEMGLSEAGAKIAAKGRG
ncbi:MAG: hypothetical protein IT315_06835 [Anaerolineales bacterium]|nr:hypothetical protein [Anaerolineales bacterium]